MPLQVRNTSPEDPPENIRHLVFMESALVIEAREPIDNPVFEA